MLGIHAVGKGKRAGKRSVVALVSVVPFPLVLRLLHLKRGNKTPRLPKESAGQLPERVRSHDFLHHLEWIPGASSGQAALGITPSNNGHFKHLLSQGNAANRSNPLRQAMCVAVANCPAEFDKLSITRLPARFPVGAKEHANERVVGRLPAGESQDSGLVLIPEVDAGPLGARTKHSRRGGP